MLIKLDNSEDSFLVYSIKSVNDLVKEFEQFEEINDFFKEDKFIFYLEHIEAAKSNKGYGTQLMKKFLEEFIQSDLNYISYRT